MQHREVDTTLHRSTAGICAVCGCRGLERVQLERAPEKQKQKLRRWKVGGDSGRSQRKADLCTVFNTFALSPLKIQIKLLPPPLQPKGLFG